MTLFCDTCTLSPYIEPFPVYAPLKRVVIARSSLCSFALSHNLLNVEGKNVESGVLKASIEKGYVIFRVLYIVPIDQLHS